MLLQYPKKGKHEAVSRKLTASFFSSFSCRYFLQLQIFCNIEIMKCRGIIVLLLLLSFSQNLIAQLEEGFDKEYVISGGAFIKTDSISSESLSFWPEIYGTYESNMSNYLSGFFRINVILPINFSIETDKTYEDTISKRKVSGFGMTLGGRYYIRGAMTGFYAGPSISYYRYNHTYEYSTRVGDYQYAINAIRGTMTLGYQHISDNGFVIHGYIGVMLDHKNYSYFVTPYNPEPSGSMNLIKPDMGFSIGYHF